MKKVVPLLLVLALSVAACSDFNKAVKSKDPKVKLQAAEQYYAKADYDRTLPLLEELLSMTRGDTLFERVSYLYAKSYFGSKDYILSGYYLENFAKTFPNSRYAEECAFLSAFCNYRQSPEYELDQGSTQAALDQLELFMVRYPETSLKDSCNTLMDGLRKKLEKKDYWNAHQYLKTRNYAAASIALANFLKRWPNSPYREDVLYNIVVSQHDLAVNSVEEKKVQRVEEGFQAYEAYMDAFPQGLYVKDVLRMHDHLLQLREETLYAALVSTHELALVTKGERRLSLVEQGLRSFDTFAAAFPQSARMKNAEHLRDELTELKERLKRPATP